MAREFCFIDKTLYVYRAPNVLQRFNAKNTVDLLHGLLDNLQFAIEHKLDKLFARTRKRIEEEYADIICCNLSVDGLALLLEINQFVKKNAENSECAIAPLDRVLQSVEKLDELNRQIALDKLIKCERIYPYGAGKACIDFLQYLEKCDLLKKVNNILVTSLSDNSSEVQGISLMEIRDYQVRPDDLVVITVSGIYRNEVIALLEEKKITNYEFVSNCIEFKDFCGKV